MSLKLKTLDTVEQIGYRGAVRVGAGVQTACVLQLLGGQTRGPGVVLVLQQVVELQHCHCYHYHHHHHHHYHWLTCDT